jgi:hypothetical protein
MTTALDDEREARRQQLGTLLHQYESHALRVQEVLLEAFALDAREVDRLYPQSL